MRLFVAVDLDDRARAALAAEQQRLEEAAAGASPMRWVRPEHLHMTLVFLGEVVDAQSTAVVEAIAKPVSLAAFDLVFAGVGAFPPRGAPRALWIGTSEGEGELRALQQELAARVGRLGVPLDRRRFSPHLTLARWKDSRPSDRGRVLAAGSGAVVARTRITHATLYQSRLSSAGPTYTPLARATLL